MSSILFRTATLEPGSGRTIYGRVVPYGETISVDDGYGEYRERFAPGAFRRSLTERGHKVRLFIGHDTRRLPIGKATSLRDEGDGVHAEFLVADTAAGNEALELVRSGVADSFSVGFRGMRDHRDNGVTVRDEAALLEVSLVGVAAYSGAEVAGVRSQSLVIPRSIAEARLSPLDW
ncbi:HK97 family phage prohead protease [Mycobacterium paragordonae]|uniref:Prophage protease n=1 Tax=Mycobacterium paragordonae TaxID=1389713 RepID=A0ABQ1CBS0_9MYCO|nr:HK97 family phage prohead protease [Mycobacterium paragordonae]AYE97911.1 HK97 family phage prohead protease [Mycobacterium paragordonae]GFG81657.1 prophage protease [Mycobacterium paragordonae]